MRYENFRNAIRAELRRIPTGLTWPQLQARLALPYARPCPIWVKRLEQEIGLTRPKGPHPAYLWKLQSHKSVFENSPGEGTGPAGNWLFGQIL